MVNANRTTFRKGYVFEVALHFFLFRTAETAFLSELYQFLAFRGHSISQAVAILGLTGESGRERS